MAEDQQIIDRWWQAFLVAGTLPDEFERVQGRLIREVFRGELPSGPVHIKVMAFPRKKDRLRYLFRALPAAHEAKMLARVREAGLPCPEVVAVRTSRRFGLPHRSMLVLRSLPLASEPEERSRRIADEVELANRLLAAGIYHSDLHRENFVRSASGELAVLDLQSASRIRSGQNPDGSVRVAVAARLLRDQPPADREQALVRMRAAGMLRSEHEVELAVSRADREGQRYRDSRVERCMTNSTEFVRRVRISGVEYRVRDPFPQGRWWSGPGDLRAAWLGQRRRHLERGQMPVFAGFFQKWWWLGGRARLYVPATCIDERIEDEVRAASLAVAGHVAGPAAPTQ